MDRIRNEPAVVIGVLAAGILAAVQAAGGQNLVGTDVVSFVSRALDPNGGWAIPVIVAIITRFFVSPAAKVGL